MNGSISRFSIVRCRYAWIRRPGKWMLNRLAGFLVGVRIPDLNSGQRVMKRDTLLRYMHLCPSGFSFTSTITLAMLANGHNVVFERVEYAKRSGHSKIRAGHFFNFVLLVVRAIVLFNPLKVFLPLGGVVFLVGVVVVCARPPEAAAPHAAAAVDRQLPVRPHRRRRHQRPPRRRARVAQ